MFFLVTRKTPGVSLSFHLWLSAPLSTSRLCCKKWNYLILGRHRLWEKA